jgi:hypothetical protein
MANIQKGYFCLTHQQLGRQRSSFRSPAETSQTSTPAETSQTSTIDEQCVSCHVQRALETTRHAISICNTTEKKGLDKYLTNLNSQIEILDIRQLPKVVGNHLLQSLSEYATHKGSQPIVQLKSIQDIIQEILNKLQSSPPANPI